MEYLCFDQFAYFYDIYRVHWDKYLVQVGIYVSYLWIDDKRTGVGSSRILFKFTFILKQVFDPSVIIIIFNQYDTVSFVCFQTNYFFA